MSSACGTVMSVVGASEQQAGFAYSAVRLLTHYLLTFPFLWQNQIHFDKNEYNGSNQSNKGQNAHKQSNNKIHNNNTTQQQFLRNISVSELERRTSPSHLLEVVYSIVAGNSQMQCICRGRYSLTK